jgi:hypothetical protein
MHVSIPGGKRLIQNSLIEDSFKIGKFIKNLELQSIAGAKNHRRQQSE